MALTKLVFRPGINRETTAYANEGGWWDSNLVRFRAGKPESIGGWTRYTLSPLLGTGRSLLTWTALDGSVYTGCGTNLKYYILSGGSVNDITPIRATTAPGGVTFAATNGSSTITATDTLHGCVAGDFVTFSGAASLGGNITATVLNKEYQVTEIVSVNSYRFTATATANASDVGNGGASVVGVYQINVALDTAIAGTGWGSGTWSRGTWGSGTRTTTPVAQLPIWSQDSFGEDLIFSSYQRRSLCEF